jgi:hypothetical protein
LSGAGPSNRFRGDAVVNTRSISGRADNGNVVSETFAQTGEVFFYGLCLFEVKAALLSGQR